MDVEVDTDRSELLLRDDFSALPPIELGRASITSATDTTAGRVSFSSNLIGRSSISHSVSAVSTPAVTASVVVNARAPPPPDPTRFASTGYRDLLWTFVFFVHTCGVIAAAAFFISKHSIYPPFMFELLGICSLIALSLSTLWLLLARFFMHYFMWIAIGGSLLCFTTVTLCFMVLRSETLIFMYPYAIGLGCCFVVTTLLAIGIRDRVDFAMAMLETCLQYLRRYPSAMIAVLAMTLVKLAWFLIWSLAAGLCLYDMFLVHGPRTYQLWLTSAGWLLSLFWSSQVISHVAHATVAGSFASWYFLYPNYSSPAPTTNAFKRATTYSFGSVVAGSLGVAFVQPFRRLLYQWRQTDACADIGCLRSCTPLSCADSAMFYFNDHAFTYVAIYGRAFFDSARDVFQLFVLNGVDQVVNDELNDFVLNLVSVATGTVTGAAAFFTSISCYGDAAETMVFGWTFVGFLLGLISCSCCLEVISASMASLFVCFTEDPTVFRSTKPALYEAVIGAWHRRFGSLHVSL